MRHHRTSDGLMLSQLQPSRVMFTYASLQLLLRDLFLLFFGFSSSESEDNSTTELVSKYRALMREYPPDSLPRNQPDASLGMTSLGGAGGGQILTAVTDPVSCNVKTESVRRRTLQRGRGEVRRKSNKNGGSEIERTKSIGKRT